MDSKQTDTFKLYINQQKMTLDSLKFIDISYIKMLNKEEKKIQIISKGSEH